MPAACYIKYFEINDVTLFLKNKGVALKVGVFFLLDSNEIFPYEAGYSLSAHDFAQFYFLAAVAQVPDVIN